MRFLIVGTGGVGGYFGSKLAKDGADVWFLARGNHYEAMRDHGLQIKSDEENYIISPEKIIAQIDDVDKADVVFFCVKTYDTIDATNQLGPVLHENSLVISFQNGIDNAEKMQSIIPHGKALGGVAYVSATITSPGEITKLAKSQRLVFGPLDGRITDLHKSVHEKMIHANIDTLLSADIKSELWKKMIFLSPVAGFSAITRLTLGEITAAEQTRTMLYKAMKEIETIALKQGIRVPSDYVDLTMEKILGSYRKTRLPNPIAQLETIFQLISVMQAACPNYYISIFDHENEISFRGVTFD